MVPWFLAALAVFLAFRFIPRLRALEVDGFMSIAFVLVPAIVMLIVHAIIPASLVTFSIGLLLSFVVPALIFKKGYSMSWGDASKYAMIVVGIVFLLDVILGVLFSAGGG
ncbi:MAG: hypothetical protein GKR90_17590 [Pseudomonadales bacterium]|nr:hypothetical protein [Pseudomonadales bacterium]